MPFADYKDFDDCVKKNQDKDSPEAYCAAIHHKATGKWPSEKESLTKKEYKRAKLEMMQEAFREQSIPSNIAKWAKEKGILADVKKIARWAQQAGERITGGTAIGKYYDTLILDLEYQDNAIYYYIDKGTIEVYDKRVNSASDFKKAVEEHKSKKSSLNEAVYSLVLDDGNGYAADVETGEFPSWDAAMKAAKKKGEDWTAVKGKQMWNKSIGTTESLKEGRKVSIHVKGKKLTVDYTNHPMGVRGVAYLDGKLLRDKNGQMIMWTWPDIEGLVTVFEDIVKSGKYKTESLKEVRDPKDYPQDVWNKAQDMTVEDADKFLDDYDRKHGRAT